MVVTEFQDAIFRVVALEIAHNAGRDNVGTADAAAAAATGELDLVAAGWGQVVNTPVPAPHLED